MKNNNPEEKIAETLEKCGIVYGLTYEEINRIAQEEILREKIREEIRLEKAAQEASKPSAWSGLSGIFLGPVISLIGIFLLPTVFGFIGGCLIVFGAFYFLVGIGMLVLTVTGAIFRGITKHI